MVDQHNPSMARLTLIVPLMTFTLALAGCGLFYQGGTRLRAERIADSLKVGQSMLDTHQKWGEPDLRQYPADGVEVWSYPYKPNTNDVIATLFYTSTKEGDKGTFLDLKFVGGKLVSWSETEHTMPSKERAGFGAGLGAPPIQPPAGQHY